MVWLHCKAQAVASLILGSSVTDNLPSAFPPTPLSAWAVVGSPIKIHRVVFQLSHPIFRTKMKKTNLLRRPGPFLQWKSFEKVALDGCKSYSILILKIERNDKKLYTVNWVGQIVEVRPQSSGNPSGEIMHYDPWFTHFQYEQWTVHMGEPLAKKMVLFDNFCLQMTTIIRIGQTV